MVHEGLVRYGPNEVVNTERLQAYVRNGVVPQGLTVDVPAVCEGLAEVVTGDGAYRTPLQDQAPWVDLDNPDTFDFAGLLPLELTGVDDTTRTVEMTKTVRDGALPGSARRGPRTVGVSALLVARTTEGAQAGLAWLQRTLHGACDTADQPCGPAATLEVFTACPGPITPTANTLVPPLQQTYPHPGDPDQPTTDWTVTGGFFDTPVTGATLLVPYDTTEVTDGGLSNSGAPAQVLDAGSTDTLTATITDGGGAAPDPALSIAGGAYPETDPGDPVDSAGAGGSLDVHSGGVARPNPGNALLAGPLSTCTDGPVRIVWSLRKETTGPESVQLVIVDDSGEAVEFGPKVDLADTLTDYEWDLPFGVDHDTWRPGIVAGYPVAVASVYTSVYPDSSPQDCVAPYRRFLPNAVTVTGPLVVEEVDAGCAVLLKVEWTWVVGSPYRYGVTTPVLDGLSADTDPTLVLPGVSWNRRLATPSTVVDRGDNAAPWSSFTSFGYGSIGGYVTFGTAPGVLPVIDRTGVLDLTTQRYISVVWGTTVAAMSEVGLAVRDAVTGVYTYATLVGTTVVPVSGSVAFRSVFLVPLSVGNVVDKLLWKSNAAPGPATGFLYFGSITTSTVPNPVSATIAATPWNCAPPVPELSCAADPCSPGFTAPPALPFITDPARPRITTQQVYDTWVCVGPEQTPTNDGVFTLTLTADDQPVVGARVRVWDDTPGDCTVDDQCAFAYEYLVDYIPAGGTLTIDGVDSTITTLCEGGAVLADSSGQVAGAFGGPTVDPVARCDRRYLIRVQWLATYPRTCETVYTQGAAQGNLTIGVAVTPREG